MVKKNSQGHTGRGEIQTQRVWLQSLFLNQSLFFSDPLVDLDNDSAIELLTGNSPLVKFGKYKLDNVLIVPRQK